MNRTESASILIPNLNGRELLKKCLPSVLEAASEGSGNHEVIVIDMGSNDGSVSFLREYFPIVKVVELQDAWIPEALNAGLKIARNEIVIIIDNDSILDEHFISPLLKHFENPKLFAVHPKLLHWDRRTIDGGKRQGTILFGIFETFGEHENEKDSGQIDTVSPVLIAEHGAFRKKILIKLGGFDSLFPLYFNRIDISYRAWKKGYFIIFEPRSVEFHKSSVRFASKQKRRFPRPTRYYKTLEEKTRLLFMWKNFTDSRLLIRHIFLLPEYLVFRMIQSGDPVMVLTAFMSASRQIPTIMKRRSYEKGTYLRSDKEVFSILNLPFCLVNIPRKYIHSTLCRAAKF